jgi:hypothetical protein
VIYLCRSGVETHFDTDRRQTVRWDLTKPDETAKHLKVVIKNMPAVVAIEMFRSCQIFYAIAKSSGATAGTARE